MLGFIQKMTLRPHELTHADADAVRAAGVSDDMLHRIMVDNPRRFLAFVPKRARKK